HLFRLYGDDIEGSETLGEHFDVTLDEHREIARAVAECRPDDAEAAMRLHLENSLQRFAPQMSGGAVPGLTVSGVPTGRIRGRLLLVIRACSERPVGRLAHCPAACLAPRHDSVRWVPFGPHVVWDLRVPYTKRR